MRANVLVLSAAALLPFAKAYALIGMGKTMYKPSCAYACRAVIASADIDCPGDDDDDDGSGGNSTSADSGMSGMSGMNMTMRSYHTLVARHGDDDDVITPQCMAVSAPFLTTLAYCLNETCTGVSTDKLESYWAKEATGDPTVAPQWGYAQSLAQVTMVPNTTFDSMMPMLMDTELVGTEDWMTQKMTLEAFERQETYHERYALVLLLVGIGIPILTTLLALIPPVNRFFVKIKPYCVYPATIKNRHVQTFLLVCHPPTLGQATYIAIFTILTTIFTAVSYHSAQPNAWFDSTYAEIMSYIGARTGVLAMALAPLVLLFAGRNNLLLWMTNWSHSTYLLLHRWVARLFGIQVILHSIVELVAYVHNGSYYTAYYDPFWIWGIVGTFCASLMLVHSVFRRWGYEWFLIIHIGLAILVLAGTWYHLEYRFEKQWGYELWMYICFAVWGLDRVLRVVRIARTGYRQAKMMPIGNGIMRVDVPGVKWSSKAGQHAYIYFPSIHHLTPWMNHPFSVIPTHLLPSPHKSTVNSTNMVETPSAEKDLEQSPLSSLNHQHGAAASSSSGVTFFIRRHDGLTNSLHYQDRTLTTRVFLEGPYYGVSSRPVLKCDRLILIAGGIGITAIYPFLQLSHHPNAKLHWSVRTHSEALVEELQPAMKDLDADITVGGRVDVPAVLEAEVAAVWKDVGVLVCGPGGMCDEVRKVVVRLSKEKGVRIELDVEAFTW